jgi:signal transduction histidine kinase
MILAFCMARRCLLLNILIGTSVTNIDVPGHYDLDGSSGDLIESVHSGTPLAHLEAYDLADARLNMLHDFIARNRDEIILRCRAKVATRSVPPPTEVEIDHGVPVFLDQLTDALRLGNSSGRDIRRTAVQHGHDLLLQGFTVSQVVHDYGDVCQAITELAVELDAPISADDFRTLNRCLDDAIAEALTEYGRERNQAGIDGEAARASERLGFFAHEMRNLINTAITAHEVLKTGNVGFSGNTSAVLQRSLTAARALIARSLAEVRLTQSILNREPLSVAAFIEEVAANASLEPRVRGGAFIVVPVEDDAVILADRQVLAAVLANLLQNAFKFTRPGTTVTLSADFSEDRVRIEVEDECGGLRSGNLKELFRPFEQQSVNRTGLGLGLAFSRWGTEANEGQLYARNLPGRGCVFTVDLPRIHVPMSVVG